MIETLIYLLIKIALLVLAIYLVLYVLAQLGIALPPQVVKIIWVIVLLIVLLMFLPTLLSLAGHARL